MTGYGTAIPCSWSVGRPRGGQVGRPGQVKSLTANARFQVGSPCQLPVLACSVKWAEDSFPGGLVVDYQGILRSRVVIMDSPWGAFTAVLQNSWMPL